MQKRGHSKSDEQKKGSALVGDAKEKPKLKPRCKPICYNCRQRGHVQCDYPNARKGPHKAETAAEERTNAFTAGKDHSHRGRWLVDSRASSHMMCDKGLLTDYQEFETPEKVGLGDSRQVDAVGAGNVHLKLLFRVSQPKMSVMYRVL